LKRTWKGLGLTNGDRTYQQEALNEFRITRDLATKEQSPCAAILDLRETPFFFESLMEDAGGDSLEKLPISVTQKHWPRILDTIEALHQQGFVHRDLKRRNIILNSQSDKTITLIDFELAGPMGSPLPCSSGTSGFKAPESEKGNPFSPAMDIYALGSLLFEIALGRDPSMYLISEEQRVQLLRLNGFNAVADIVKRIYGQTESRPSLSELRNLTASTQVFQPSAPIVHRVTNLEVNEVIDATLESLKVFERWSGPNELQWANQHLLSSVHHRGINIGSSGILIGLTQLKLAASNPAVSKLEFKTEPLDLLIRATANGLIRGTPYDNAHGFMTGNAGTAYALSLAGRHLDEPAWIDAAIQLWISASSQRNEPDFFSGVAGILFGGLHLIKFNNRIELKPIAEELVQYLIDEVVDYDGLWAWPPSIEFGGLPTLGASHGAAGIAMVLSQWAAFVDDQDLMSFATEVFQRIFQFGRSSNGHSLRYDIHPQSQPRAATDWCHGAGSYLWAMINSSCLPESLTEEIEWAKTLFLKSPISSNPTYCHGLAGQLELAMMLGETERAERIKRALMLQRRAFHQNSTWPSENPEQFSPDLWVGFLGPTVALIRAQVGHKTALFSSQLLAPPLQGTFALTNNCCLPIVS
jgi:serine/threonine protein kinase